MPAGPVADLDAESGLESTPESTVGLVIEGVEKAFPGYGQVLDGVDLHVAAGTSLAVLGPSGCGKTTLLRIIAGLDVPDRGSVRLGTRVLSGQGAWVEPERRNIGMVFQDWALFEHLNVSRNVGFGLPRSERRSSTRIEEGLELVGLSDFAERSTTTLSGGQRQRVALARALAPRPEVLLLDEPFSNLDAALRASVRGEVRRILRELSVTSVFVTHDQEEAFLLGDRVAVMNEGKVVQFGTPIAIYEQPVNKWLATFVGDATFVDATASDGFTRTAFGEVRVDPSISGEVELLIRPERVGLMASTSGVTGTVTEVEYLGHSTRYALDVDGQLLVARQSSSPQYEVGQSVGVDLGDGEFWGFPR